MFHGFDLVGRTAIWSGFVFLLFCIYMVGWAGHVVMIMMCMFQKKNKSEHIQGLAGMENDRHGEPASQYQT